MKIIIIGGGASGLMAAVTAAKYGAAVTVLEQNNTLGKKLLASGNGRCNLTNVTQQPCCYRGEHPEFAWQLINTFNLADTIKFFTKAGIYVKNKAGWLYPYSEQAASVLEVLRMEAEHLQVKLKTCEEVISVTAQQPGFTVTTRTWRYQSDQVIIAAGTPASAVTGAGASGYRLAEALGHTLIKPLPALVPLRGSGDYFAKWAGVRMECSVTLQIDRELLPKRQGEVQFTDYGLSGIPIFQLSRFAVRALDQQRTVTAILDFMPDFTAAQLHVFLQRRQQNCPYKTLEKMLIGLFPAKIIPVLCHEVSSLEQLAARLKAYPVLIKAAHSMEQAQICCGGVNTAEITPDRLESKIHPGLFFAGEVVDVDGDCGGYNLQWAWSSGAVAGAAAANAPLTMEGV